MDRYFPEARAIDPRTCGCTECIVGFYVPANEWFRSANAADVQAFITGEVGDHTYESNPVAFVIENTSEFQDLSAHRFIAALNAKMQAKAPKLAAKINVDEFASEPDSADRWV